MNSKFAFVAGWANFDGGDAQRYVFVGESTALVVDIKPQRSSIVVSKRESGSYPFSRWVKDPEKVRFRVRPTVEQLIEILEKARAMTDLLSGEF